MRRRTCAVASLVPPAGRFALGRPLYRPLKNGRRLRAAGAPGANVVAQTSDGRRTHE